MKRQKQGKLTSATMKKVTYNGCINMYPSVFYFKHHIKDNHACKLCYMLCCQTCQFVGYNKNSLLRHILFSEAWTYFDKQREVAVGLLLDTSLEYIIQNKKSPNISTYTFKYYSTDDVVDNIQLYLQVQ